MIGNVFLIVGAVTLIGIVGGIVLHSILSLYLEGGISGSLCVLIGLLYILIVVSIFALQLYVAIFLLLVLGAGLLLSQLREGGAQRRFNRDRIEQFRRTIDSDPSNLAARGRLARELYAIGRLEEAIAEQTALVTLSPHDRAETQRLRNYMEELDEKGAKPVKCPGCGHMNPHGRTKCEDCECELSALKELRKWLAGGGLRQIVITWAISMGAITLVLLGFTMLSMPARIGLAAALLIIVIVGAMVHYYRST